MLENQKKKMNKDTREKILFIGPSIFKVGAKKL